ncbi:MAG: MraY family glycosyltransferase [Balneolaceae bacterium]|nr:MraY family glycosyltransferase [Balneolaceae bacterium]
MSVTFMATFTLQSLGISVSSEILIFTVLTFLSSYLLYFPFIKLCHERGWVDKPTISRKVHKHAVATSGGVIFVAVFLASILFFSAHHTIEHLNYLIFGLCLVLLIGLKDDFMAISPHIRLFAHFVISVATVWVLELEVSTFVGLFGIQSIPAPVASLVGIFAMMTIINAYNLIDGIDGLAASMAILASVGFCIGFIAFEEPLWAAVSCLFGASLAGFVLHNKQPASVFMGDAGSVSVGYMVAIQALMFLRISTTSLTPTPVGETLAPIAPIYAMALLCIPLFDLLQVMVFRMVRGQSPFTADQKHIHHILLQQGLSHGVATMVCVVWSLMMVAAAILLGQVMSITLAFLVMLNVMVLFLLALEIVPYMIYRIVRGDIGEE